MEDSKETRIRFAALMKALAVNASVEIEPDVILVYFHALKQFDLDDLEDAVTQILYTWEFNRMPPISEIVKSVTGKRQIEDRAVVVATQIIAHLKAHGAKERPNLQADPIANELMTSRWPYYTWASQVVDSELKWWMKRFCEAYRAYEATDAPLMIEAAPEIKKLTEDIGNV